MSPVNKTFPSGTVALFGLFALVMLATYLLTKPAPVPDQLQGVLRPQFVPIQQMQLTDHNNNAFTQRNFAGKWSFVFFGYLSCPDICPTTLRTLSILAGHLEKSGGDSSAQPEFVFVSVDPKRDTTDRIRNYVTFFNQKFLGVTAEQEQIEKFSRQFGAGYIHEEEYAPGQYAISHTSAIFLVSPDGRLVATFSQPHYAEVMADQYQQIREYFRS